ncbi:unnamed protein product [Hermetia illucens]|uniref:J domain-containing protein n=2 Tax=Hermetia illucens TaxID=343691 RepID=A0A7R8Z0H0_HERIL|nr:unnamed protein product [Hermetia illucens]
MARCDRLSISRSICTTSVLLVNYYEVLGIPRSATQSDIKAAYYRLSMLHHPDKNKDNAASVEKFREITEAYEVLGNFRLKRLYDKGIIHTAGSQYAHMRPRFHDEDVKEEPDDPQTKFYKAHMKKSQVPHASGRTPIYNFDEWSRAHYGASFERRKAAKEKFETKERKRAADVATLEKEILLIGIAFLFACMFLVFKQESGLDVFLEKGPPAIEVENSIDDQQNKTTVQVSGSNDLDKKIVQQAKN